jgi:hypothetical protein
LDKLGRYFGYVFTLVAGDIKFATAGLARTVTAGNSGVLYHQA